MSDSEVNDSNVNPLYLATSQSEHSSLTRRGHKKNSSASNDSTRSQRPAVGGDNPGLLSTASSGSLPSLTSRPAQDDEPAAESNAKTAQPAQSRLVRVHSAVSPARLPRVNCQEKIVICLDTSKEMEKKYLSLRQGDKKSPMELVKKALGIFIHSKNLIGKHHEFALMALGNKANMVCSFTSDPQRIITILGEMGTRPEPEGCNLTSVFTELASCIKLQPISSSPDWSPPFILRLVLIYGRSHCRPEFDVTAIEPELYSSELFCTDVLYIHEPPNADNQCEATFDELCSLDVHGMSYILETSGRNPTKIFDCLAQLLAHPLQRPLQDSTNYQLNGQSVTDGRY